MASSDMRSVRDLKWWILTGNPGVPRGPGEPGVPWIPGDPGIPTTPGTPWVPLSPCSPYTANHTSRLLVMFYF